MAEEFGPLAPYSPVKRKKYTRKTYDASQLWRLWSDFSTWVNANQIDVVHKVVQKGAVIEYTIPRPRPYFLSEFLRFAGVAPTTWKKWKTSRPELEDTIRDIETIVQEQRLLGAYTNQFNGHVASQDLGLTTKMDVKTKDSGFEEFLRNREANVKSRQAYEARHKKK